MDGQELVVGALRNRAWDHARGELMTCWDDDDVHHPERLAYQVAAFKGWPVAMQNELVLHLLTGDGFVFFYHFGFANTLLWPRGCVSRYSDEPRDSDTHFLHSLSQEFGRITRLDNLPSLYVRVFHGRNVWDEGHLFGAPQRDAARHPGIRVDPPTAEERRLLDGVLATHRQVADWAADARSTLVPAADGDA